MHLFVHGRQQENQFGGGFVEAVETLEHETAAETLDTNCVCDLGKQQIGDIQLLVVEIGGKVETAVPRDKVDLAAVFGDHVPKIVDIENNAGSIVTLFEKNFAMGFQRVGRLFPPGHFVIGRILDGHSVVCVESVVSAVVGDSLDEATGSFGECEHLDGGIRLQHLEIEHIHDFDHFEVGARDGFVFADTSLVRVGVDVFVWVGELFVDVPVLAHFGDLVLDFCQIVVE